MGWQWHQLDHMQILCTSLQTDNHASTSSLDFLQTECFSNQQRQNALYVYSNIRRWSQRMHSLLSLFGVRWQCPQIQCPQLPTGCRDERLTDVLIGEVRCKRCPACYDSTIFNAWRHKTSAFWRRRRRTGGRRGEGEFPVPYIGEWMCAVWCGIDRIAGKQNEGKQSYGVGYAGTAKYGVVKR